MIEPGVFRFPALHGLINELPVETADGKWTPERRSAFLHAFTLVLDFSLPPEMEATPPGWGIDPEDLDTNGVIAPQSGRVGSDG